MLTDDEHIRSLNRDYRGKDEPTDVLSFSLREAPPSQTSLNLAEHNLLGEVYISVPTALRQAQMAERPLEEEVVFLAVHGVLHLLGYEDETQSGYEQMLRRGWEIVHATQAGREAR